MRPPANLAPELLPIVERMPVRADPYADLALTRRLFRILVAQVTRLEPPPVAVAIDELSIDGPASPIPLRCYRPASPRGDRRPIVLYFHGGGFCYGSAPDADHSAGLLVAELDATVLSVEYRLAPEHRFPAGFEDCFAALEWAARRAGELGCDPARLAVMGVSAGACLAAATALFARDRGGPAIAFQCLLIPTLDDRRTRPSARSVDDPRFVNAASAARAWATYLGEQPGEVPPHAAPLRAADLSRLPPAYVQTCEIDPHRDDGLDYARRLLEAGVSTEIHSVAGAFHAFELLAPHTRLARDTTRLWVEAMHRALVPVAAA